MEVYQAGAGSAKVFAFLIERTRGPRWCSFPPGVIVGIAPGPVAAISVIRIDRYTGRLNGRRGRGNIDKRN